jgi:Flp pilus assembly protein TadD
MKDSLARSVLCLGWTIKTTRPLALRLHTLKRRTERMTTRRKHPKAQPGQLSAKDQRKVVALGKRLERHINASKATAMELMDFYATRGMDEPAKQNARALIGSFDDPGQRAAACVNVGVHMERAGRFELAAWAYSTGVALEPTEPDLWYWLNNNLGFSLNQVGRHAEAEPCCRTAIRSQPQRYNAHKNLGVALEGQGSIVAAAQSYIMAVQLGPGDPRAFGHLLLLEENYREELQAGAPAVLAFVAERLRGVMERVRHRSDAAE